MERTGVLKNIYKIIYITTDHIFNMKCILIYNCLEERIFCAFIYHRKEFDSVDRILLWQKLWRKDVDYHSNLVQKCEIFCMSW